jgi:membrane associated rhomboid family serine protease
MTTPPPPAGQEPPAGSPYPGQYGYPHPGPPVQYGQPIQYGPPAVVEACAFHPDRQTALHCTRCGRPACPECLTQASVGFQCRACVAEGRAAQRAPLGVTGARISQQPIVTFTLIGINVLVFLITAVQARSGTDLTPSAVYRDGLLAPTLVASGQFWRLLTGGFLHASVVHIALNMLSLYFLGLPMERILGRARFLVVYLLALLGGSAAVMLFAGELTPTIGASGAIFGLMGGLVVVFKRFRYDMKQLLFVLAINLYLSFQLSGISWQGHLGGLVVGAAITVAMVYPAQAIRRRVQIGAAVGLLVLIVVVILVRDTQIAVRCTELTQTDFLGCSGG